MKLTIRLSDIKVYLLGMIYITAILNIIEVFEQISLLTIVTALFCGVVLVELIQRGKLDIKSPYLLLPLVLVAITWFSLAWTQSRAVSMSRNYAYTILPVFFLMTHLSGLNEKDLRIIDKFIIFGGLCFVVYVLITQGISGIMSARFATTEDMDQNATCATLFLVAFVLVKNIILRREQRRSIGYYVFLLIWILWLYVMTGSRSGLLAAAMFIAVMTLYGKRNKMIRILAITAVVSLIVLVIAPLVLPEDIYVRLFKSDSYQTTMDSEKDRVAIWTYCFDALVPNVKLLGFGSGVPPYLIGPHFDMPMRGVHNTYLAMYLEYGVLGLPFFLWFLICFIRDAVRNKDRICLGAVLGIIIIIFFLESYSRTYLWCILTYCLVSSKRIPEHREDYTEALR